MHDTPNSRVVIVCGEKEHFETVAHFLREDFRDSKKLCDVSLRFEKETVLAHSTILAAFSQFFAERFQKQSNKKEDMFHVDLSFLRKESVENVLIFLYYGEVVIRGETLHDDLEAISFFGVARLQEEVEKKLVELAREGHVAEVLNVVTHHLKSAPHSPSTLLAISDETVTHLVDIFHEDYKAKKLLYEQVLRLSPNTIITMLSSRVNDSNKLDLLNMALKWMHETRLSDEKASSIIGAITFRSMTYSQLAVLRDSLIAVSLPVVIGKCVHVERGENGQILISGLETDSFIPEPFHRLLAPLDSSDPTVMSVSPSRSSTSASRTRFEMASKSSSSLYGIDDCSTAISFDESDLKLLNIERQKM